MNLPTQSWNLQLYGILGGGGISPLRRSHSQMSRPGAGNRKASCLPCAFLTFSRGEASSVPRPHETTVQPPHRPSASLTRHGRHHLRALSLVRATPRSPGATPPTRGAEASFHARLRGTSATIYFSSRPPFFKRADSSFPQCPRLQSRQSSVLLAEGRAKRLSLPPHPSPTPPLKEVGGAFPLIGRSKCVITLRRGLEVRVPSILRGGGSVRIGGVARRVRLPSGGFVFFSSGPLRTAAMQELIASVDHIKFELEIAVEQQLGAQPLPFPGMDST